eukprot:TRINITY_DN11174_c0_g1_i1.p1 TRINITY_DN11174_c0_g1~~TRINITY_DN11174_c0_g1_i1.p1  ORF type:complete len:182 (+),score=29.44 TRINITY_DN11174_c0_g1_i1:67-612(+)
MCIRDRYQRRVHGILFNNNQQSTKKMSSYKPPLCIPCFCCFAVKPKRMLQFSFLLDIFVTGVLAIIHSDTWMILPLIIALTSAVSFVLSLIKEGKFQHTKKYLTLRLIVFSALLIYGIVSFFRADRSVVIDDAAHKIRVHNSFILSVIYITLSLCSLCNSLFMQRALSSLVNEIAYDGMFN